MISYWLLVKKDQSLIDSTVNLLLIFFLLTKAWSEYVRDSLRGIGQEDSPVETEDNDYKQNGDDDFVDWLNGGHTSADGNTYKLSMPSTICRHRQASKSTYIKCW